MAVPSERLSSKSFNLTAHAVMMVVLSHPTINN